MRAKCAQALRGRSIDQQQREVVGSFVHVPPNLIILVLVLSLGGDNFSINELSLACECCSGQHMADKPAGEKVETADGSCGRGR